MDGESTVMDSGERAEAALSMFESDTQQEAGNSVPLGDDGATDTQEQSPTGDAPEGQQPETEAAEISEEQLNADPRFQELSNYKTDVEGVFGEFGIPDLNEAKLQLADSQVLYQIAKGEADAGQLMDAFTQAWPKEAVQRTAEQLASWLQKNGFIQGADKAAGKDAVKDPLAEKVNSLESKLTEREKQEVAQREEARRSKIQDSFASKISELAKQKQIPEKYIPDYVMKIAAKVGGNQSIIGRIEKGNFVDVQRFFAEIHNGEIERAQKFSESQMRTQQNKQKNAPRIPAGGAPPAPANAGRPTLAKTRDQANANAEQRRKTAAEML